MATQRPIGDSAASSSSCAAVTRLPHYQPHGTKSRTSSRHVNRCNLLNHSFRSLNKRCVPMHIWLLAGFSSSSHFGAHIGRPGGRCFKVGRFGSRAESRASTSHNNGGTDIVLQRVYFWITFFLRREERPAEIAHCIQRITGRGAHGESAAG